MTARLLKLLTALSLLLCVVACGLWYQTLDDAVSIDLLYCDLVVEKSAVELFGPTDTPGDRRDRNLSRASERTASSPWA
jgi:hypothetical protein